MICSGLTWAVLLHIFLSGGSLTVQLNGTRPTGVIMNIFLSGVIRLWNCSARTQRRKSCSMQNLCRTNFNASFIIPGLGSQDEHCKRRKRLLSWAELAVACRGPAATWRMYLQIIPSGKARDSDSDSWASALQDEESFQWMCALEGSAELFRPLGGKSSCQHCWN